MKNKKAIAWQTAVALILLVAGIAAIIFFVSGASTTLTDKVNTIVLGAA